MCTRICGCAYICVRIQYMCAYNLCVHTIYVCIQFMCAYESSGHPLPPSPSALHHLLSKKCRTKKKDFRISSQKHPPSLCLSFALSLSSLLSPMLIVFEFALKMSTFCFQPKAKNRSNVTARNFLENLPIHSLSLHSSKILYVEVGRVWVGYQMLLKSNGFYSIWHWTLGVCWYSSSSESFKSSFSGTQTSRESLWGFKLEKVGKKDENKIEAVSVSADTTLNADTHACVSIAATSDGDSCAKSFVFETDNLPPQQVH